MKSIVGLCEGVTSNRRDFLRRSGALAAASLAAVPRRRDEKPLGRAVRYDPVICVAPMFLAEELLRMEGFTEIAYLKRHADETVPDALREGRADLTATNAPSLMLALDSGQPIKVIAGMHVGCFELFGNDRVNAIRDLKGKRIAISATGSGEQGLQGLGLGIHAGSRRYRG